jgi:hypothetical protein
VAEEAMPAEAGVAAVVITDRSNLA